MPKVIENQEVKMKQKKPKNVTTPLKDVMKSKLVDTIEVKIKKGDYKLPSYAHEGDAGLDVYATSVEYLKDIDSYVYHTGLYMESDAGVACYLLPRSSNRKTDAYMPNSPGLGDVAIYRGELCFTFKNRTDIDVTAAIAAIAKIGNMPWWKRLFANFTKEWETAINELTNNPLAWAPYEVGDKIGQLVFFKYPTVKFKIVDELTETERGEGGFGSTGK